MAKIRSKKGTTYELSRIRRRWDKTYYAQVIITGASGMPFPTVYLYFDENRKLSDYAGVTSVPLGVIKVAEKAGFII